MVGVFVTRWFNRWARKEGILDRSLCRAIDEIERGLIDANLGGNLYKKRVAAPGRGKRGSHRTLVAFKSGDKSFFVYGFAKNKKDNIDNDEKRAFKALAKEYFDLGDNELKKALDNGRFRQLRCDGEQEKA